MSNISEAMLELQKGIYAAITADTSIMSILAGVYDEVPDDAQFPYLQIGDGRGTEHISTGGTSRNYDISLVINIYSRAGGRREILDVGQKLSDILKPENITVTGYNLSDIRQGYVAVRQNRDARTWVASLRIEASL